MIKVPCLLLAFFRRYLRGYQNKFGLASSKLSVSRDKRKKMWTHKKKRMSTAKMKFAFRSLQSSLSFSPFELAFLSACPH